MRDVYDMDRCRGSKIEVNNRLKRELIRSYIKGEIDDAEFMIRFEVLVRAGIRIAHEAGGN